MWESQDRDKYLARAREVTVALQNMVQEILVISRMESCGFLIRKKKRWICRPGEASAGNLKAFGRKIWNWKSFVPEKCPCMADSGLMAIAVRNILVNAVRYSPAGERISVTTEWIAAAPSKIEKYEKYSEDTSGSGKHLLLCLTFNGVSP